MDTRCVLIYHKHRGKTHKSPYSRLQSTTPMNDLSNNTGPGSLGSESLHNLLQSIDFTNTPEMIPDKEVANNSINQEILKLFLNDGCHRKDPRPTFFRNHNREMHSRNMEQVVTQHPCPNRTFIMATAHNICQTLAKLNRKHCFTLSLGFTLIHVWSIQYGVLIGHLCHPMRIMKTLRSLANHRLDFHSYQNRAQNLV